MMIYKQRYMFHAAMLSFGDDQLEYSHSYFNNKQGGFLPYERLPELWKFSRKKSWRPKYFLLAGVVAAAIIMISVCELPAAQSRAAVPQAIPPAAFFLVSGAVLYMLGLVFGRCPAVTFIAVNAKPAIWILRDRQHDAIENELRRRRRDAIRKKFGEINPENPAAFEIRRFKALHRQGIFTDQELAAIIIQLTQKPDTEDRRQLH